MQRSQPIPELSSLIEELVKQFYIKTVKTLVTETPPSRAVV